MRVSDDTSLELNTAAHIYYLQDYNTGAFSISLLPFPGSFLVLEVSTVLLLLLPVVSVALQDGRDGDTADTAGSEHTQVRRGREGETKGRRRK